LPQNAIDKDLHLIKKWLFRGYESYYAAEDVYREGAHSKSVAKLNLKTPLDTEIPAGSEVVGFTKTGGAQVKGRLLETAKANQTVVLVRYDVNEIQANYVNCQVGGSPAPETSGCEWIPNESFLISRVSFWLTFSCSSSL
jgi:hypothetical protein